MNLIIKNRGTGKTTQMIYTSEATQIPIIVENEYRKTEIIKMSREMNCYIPEPITTTNLNKGFLSSRYIQGVLIDEGDSIIEKALEEYLGCKVVAITLSDKLKKRYKHE